jgi:NADH-quinone oxidoreductase subunit A
MSVVIPVLTLATLVLLFGTTLVFLTSLVGPKKPNPVKAMPYECGVPGYEKRDTKVSVKFYLTAILFILFDIEVVFMYPWALIFKEFLNEAGVFLFVEMLLFIFVVIYGLVYVWKSGALEWD